jgi:hypothetical protein
MFGSFRPLGVIGLLVAVGCSSSSANSPADGTPPDGSAEDSASVPPDTGGGSIEASDGASKGPDATLDAGQDGPSSADAGDGAPVGHCNNVTLGNQPFVPFANADAGTLPTGTGGTVVSGTYKLSAINAYGDTGTISAGTTAAMTMTLEQGDGGQTFVGQIIEEQSGGGYTANMEVTFSSNQYAANYTCVEPLPSSPSLSFAPPGNDGFAVTYTYDAASKTLHLYEGYGSGYGSPGNARLYEHVLALQP